MTYALSYVLETMHWLPSSIRHRGKEIGTTKSGSGGWKALNRLEDRGSSSVQLCVSTLALFCLHLLCILAVAC